MKTRNTLTVVVLAVLLAFGLASVAPAYGATILVDFGNAISWRGVSTPSPDVNGNYWNSVWSGAYYPGLKDTSGNTTAVNFGFSSAGGTDSYNGPAGVVLGTPPTAAEIAATDIDAAALGNLGVKEAAMDYYTNSTFEIQGLDPAKKYNLTFFGSHKFGGVTTVYSVYTDNTFSTLVNSVNLDVTNGAMPWLHNRDTVATLSNLSPQMFNILYVKFEGINQTEGYLNALQIQEVPEPATLALLLAGGLLARKRR
jgi:hypothetical protein